MIESKLDERGIFLKWSVFRDKETTLSEKVLFLEINNLSMLDKGCIASNSHFADTLGVRKEAISRLISSLEKKGYITTEIVDGTRNHSRIITINKMLSTDNKMLFRGKQNVNTPLTNCLETKENKKMNKTMNNIYKKNLGISDRVELWKIEAQKEILPTDDQLPIFEKFRSYWTSHNSSDLKFTAEKQKTFIYKQRFATWLSNHKKWDNQKTTKTEINNAWDYLEQVHKEETDKKFNKKHNEVITNG